MRILAAWFAPSKMQFLKKTLSVEPLNEIVCSSEVGINLTPSMVTSFAFVPKRRGAFTIQLQTRAFVFADSPLLSPRNLELSPVMWKNVPVKVALSKVKSIP